MLSAAICCLAQRKNGLTSANACRHVAILGREGFKGAYSARCFIPARLVEDENLSLRNIIDREWRWVYSHLGSAAGQVIARGENSVLMLSQKNCLDMGKTVGRPVRNYYKTIGNNAKAIGIIGAFTMLTEQYDAYADCAFNPTQWHDFEYLNDTKPKTAKQYVRRNLGDHLGSGSSVIPFNFSYGERDLNDAFRNAITDALNRKDRSNASAVFRSGQPIVLTKFPFESGLSIISAEAPAASTGGVLTNIAQDLSALGWNRALQAMNALSDRPNPPLPKPEGLHVGDLLSIVVLTVVSIVLYKQALKTAARSRQENMSQWNVQRERWVRIKKRSDYAVKRRSGSAIVLLSLISAVVALIAAFFEFHESFIRPEKMISINSGGLVTYGETNSTTSIDNDNLWAGTEFIINHWVVANIERSGSDPVYIIVCIAIGIGFVVLILLSYKFSMRREHSLDAPLVRSLLRIIQWPILVMESIASRTPFLARFFNSYDKTFTSVYNELSRRYGRNTREVKLRNVFNVYSRLKLSRFTTADNLGTTRFTQRDSEFSRMISPMVAQDASLHSLSDNEIEKAAEVLAADTFGLLNYCQALTIMYGESLAKVVDNCISKDIYPNMEQVQQLARIWYVTEAIVPSRRGLEIDPREYTVHVGEIHARSVGEAPPYCGENSVFAPIIGYRPVYDRADSGRYNDGILCTLYERSTS